MQRYLPVTTMCTLSMYSLQHHVHMYFHSLAGVPFYLLVASEYTIIYITDGGKVGMDGQDQ